MDLLTKMVEHHVWLTGEMVRVAARLTDEQLDQPIELDVDDDRQTIRSLLSRLVGQMGMWNAAMATRDYDWSVEEHESLASMRRAAGGRGLDVPRARPRRRRPRPPRRHLRRRAVRAGRGLHLRRHDRPRADLRGPPPHPGRARPRPPRRRRARLGRPDAAGSPSRPEPLTRPAGPARARRRAPRPAPGRAPRASPAPGRRGSSTVWMLTKSSAAISALDRPRATRSSTSTSRSVSRS